MHYDPAMRPKRRNRPGAGRPRLSKTSATRNVALVIPEDELDLVDKDRGEVSRAAWIRGAVRMRLVAITG